MYFSNSICKSLIFIQMLPTMSVCACSLPIGGYGIYTMFYCVFICLYIPQLFHLTNLDIY